MNLKDALPPKPESSDLVNVVVEIPKGSQNKYEYDVELGILKLDRVLFSPLHYPGDYGFIPQTLAKDGDPQDVLVLVSFPTFSGVVIEARPIGVMIMMDDGEEDDKILCVPENDIRFSRFKNISDVEEPILNEIAHFFTVYKELEGKNVSIAGWKDLDKAKEIINESIEAYKEAKQ